MILLVKNYLNFSSEIGWNRMVVYLKWEAHFNLACMYLRLPFSLLPARSVLIT